MFHSYVNVYQRVILDNPWISLGWFPYVSNCFPSSEKGHVAKATAPGHCWGSAPSKSQVSPPAWLAAFGSYIVKLGRSHHWFYGYLMLSIKTHHTSIFIIIYHSHPPKVSFYLWFAAKRLLCNPRGFHRSSGPQKSEPWRHDLDDSCQSTGGWPRWGRHTVLCQHHHQLANHLGPAEKFQFWKRSFLRKNSHCTSDLSPGIHTNKSLSLSFSLRTHIHDMCAYIYIYTVKLIIIIIMIIIIIYIYITIISPSLQYQRIRIPLYGPSPHHPHHSRAPNGVQPGA